MRFRRLGIFVFSTALLIGAGWLSGRFLPGKDSAPPEKAVEVPIDPAEEKAWRQRHPRLFQDSLPASLREGVILPLLRKQGLGPRNLRSGAGYWELILPKGKPIHAYAFEAESLFTLAGLTLEEGRELDPPGERVEYRVRKGSGAVQTLRLALGAGIRSGAVRMALVVVSVPTQDAALARRMLGLETPLTLALSSIDSLPVAGEWRNFQPGRKEIFLELPMEPSAYPHVKPGPGALFIHHGQAEIEKLMDRRLKRFPSARGFATRHGGRAIENRPLMEKVLGYAASHTLLFLDLTESPRTLVPVLAPRMGAVAFTAKVQEPVSEGKLEEEMARLCALAERTGSGIWTVRHSKALPDQIERLLAKHKPRFAEMGLEWVTLSALRR